MCSYDTEVPWAHWNRISRRRRVDLLQRAEGRHARSEMSTSCRGASDATPRWWTRRTWVPCCQA